MSEAWENWAGNETCHPRDLLRPSSVTELSELVGTAAAAGREIRVAGSGHSFTPAVLTDDLLLDVDAIAGVIDADRESGLVRVGGGTVLADLNRELDRLGLAMPNLGDIDVQTISGAISTATHGTGAGLKNISAQVEAIELVTASGDVLELAGDTAPELLRAARVSVGSLGVISAVTLQTVPAFSLHRIDEPMPLERVLSDFDELAAANDHFEFFVFPFTDKALTIRRNRTDEPPRPRSRFNEYMSDAVIENGLGNVALKMMRRYPGMIRKTARLSSAFMGQSQRVDVSHRVFANLRKIRFVEMEYALPSEAGPGAMAEILAMIDREDLPVAMPIECRVVAGDDAMLSPTYERPSTYIAVHLYEGVDWRPYFEAVEEIFDRHGGRPHWGKRHTKSAATLAPLYPEWEKFAAIRDRLDPNRTFSNDYARTVLGD